MAEDAAGAEAEQPTLYYFEAGEIESMDKRDADGSLDVSQCERVQQRQGQGREEMRGELLIDGRQKGPGEEGQSVQREWVVPTLREQGKKYGRYQVDLSCSVRGPPVRYLSRLQQNRLKENNACNTQSVAGASGTGVTLARTRARKEAVLGFSQGVFNLPFPSSSRTASQMMTALLDMSYVSCQSGEGRGPAKERPSVSVSPPNRPKIVRRCHTFTKLSCSFCIR